MPVELHCSSALVFGDSTDVVSGKLGAAPFRRERSATLPEFSAERFVSSYAIGNLNGTSGRKYASLRTRPVHRP